MLSNAQIINKAGAIQTSSLSHGLLNPEQAKNLSSRLLMLQTFYRW